MWFMNIQAMIVELRELGFTQAAIGKATDIAQPTISRMETGAHKDTSYTKALRIKAMLFKARNKARNQKKKDAAV